MVPACERSATGMGSGHKNQSSQGVWVGLPGWAGPKLFRLARVYSHIMFKSSCTCVHISQMQVPMSGDHSFTTCTCFSIWRDHIWVGTNRGAIVVMDSTDGRCVREIFFPGGRRRQVEIKHLALSSEEEVQL